MSSFDYSYIHDTRNDIIDNNVEAEIIPNDEFIIEVETYDEYIIQKGFPENDETLNNIFDHDISLDEHGILNNIPRKTYITTSDYDNTEPKYNNRLTEDDYHYMKRQLEYALKLHEIHLPVAEIWKLYGVQATMLNRQRFLVKMFDITKHPHHRNDDGELIVDDWVPEPWEHKDKFCKTENLLGEFFFVSADNVQPVKKHPVNFSFSFVNSIGEILTDDDYRVDIYLNNELLISDYSMLRYKCDSELLDEYSDNIFTFIGRRNDKIIGEIAIIITVKGCNTADIYVKCNGSNNNNGDKDHPYETLKKGVDNVTKVKGVIALVGDNTTSGKIPVNKSCSILGCNSASLLNNNAIFFNVKKNINLNVQDITFITDYGQGTPENMSWINEKESTVIETVLAYNLNYGVLIEDIIPTKFIKNLSLNSGVLSWDEYDKSEFTKLSDFEGIATNLELSDDLYYCESEIHENDTLNLNGPFVYFEDREELVAAFSNLTFNGTVISFDEIRRDEIVNDAKLHDIFGVDS
ncbi:hypothetical protein [Methanobrevibacter sp.]|uniref:hypothetical protein n=1 Tax=Methanobrevibacter sp. TaxID=66852 RepID=UPI00389081DD